MWAEDVGARDDAVEAGARIGAIFKEPTITPTLEQKGTIWGDFCEWAVAQRIMTGLDAVRSAHSSLNRVP